MHRSLCSLSLSLSVCLFFFASLSLFFPKASPMFGFSFSLLEGVERDRTGPWCGRDVWWWSGTGVIRDGCDTGWVWYGMGVMGVWYGIGVLNGMGVIWDECDTRWVWWVWTGARIEDGGSETVCVCGRVWKGVDGGVGVDGTGKRARLVLNGGGRGWVCGREQGRERDKMEGSEIGCGVSVCLSIPPSRCLSTTLLFLPFPSLSLAAYMLGFISAPCLMYCTPVLFRFFISSVTPPFSASSF